MAAGVQPDYVFIKKHLLSMVQEIRVYQPGSRHLAEKSSTALGYTDVPDVSTMMWWKQFSPIIFQTDFNSPSVQMTDDEKLVAYAEEK